MLTGIRSASLVTTFAIVAGVGALGFTSTVNAAPSPVGQRTPDVPTAVGLPTVQIDGVAW
jgi:hypothetical protein